ncbi:MAG: hypothetical protein NZZ41_04845 [Candidatus Dojkabacteria bacterium]|nr:hypothetical protein [Candidatus Dojkabacteria bacterium]
MINNPKYNKQEKIKDVYKEIALDPEGFYYGDDDNLEDEKDEFYCQISERKNKINENDYIEEDKNITEDNDNSINENEDIEDFTNNEDDEDDLRFKNSQKFLKIYDEDDEKENKNYKEFENIQNMFYKIPNQGRKFWYDDPQKLKFKNGDVVVYKNDQNGDTFVICYPSENENYYFIKRNKTLNEFEEHGEKLVIAPPHNNVWQNYWSQFPVIPAPKNFKKKI